MTTERPTETFVPGLTPGVSTARGRRFSDPGRKPGALGERSVALLTALVVSWVGLLSAQAVPRADLPRAGAIRVTFDPIITFWDEELQDGARRRLGAFLTGDSLGAAQNAQLARLDQDLKVATGVPTVVANLGAAVLALRAERRVTPLLIELGVGDRLSLGVRVPLVRVQARAGFSLDSTNGNLGRNPRGVDPLAESSYEAFFLEFDAALTQLNANIAGNSYGCPSSPQCAAAQAFRDTAAAVRDALRRAALGTGVGDAAPFLPDTASALGAALNANVLRLQNELVATWGVSGFNDSFLLPTRRATTSDVLSMLAAPPPGYDAAPFQDTRRGLRFWLGDVELEARFRLAHSPGYRATAGALVRLPTGHQESAHSLIDLSAGDGQLDVEGQLTQEVRLGRLWLNAATRLGMQTAGERERRVAPAAAILVPRAATALLGWDPGDYVVVDAAPMYRFNQHFAAGMTLGWSAQSEDRYTYRSAQDSLAIATALGGPLAARILNSGTGVRVARLGGAVTYAGPVLEGSFVVERVVSARGGWVPALTSVRIVLRTSRRLF